MRNLRQLFQLKRRAWSLVGGVLLAGLLGGCQTPFIDIKIEVANTCSPGSTRSSIPDDGGAGACILNPANPYNGPLIPTNHKVCKDFNNNTVACTGNEMCTGATSRVCNSSPGSENRKTCKSVWKQSAAGSINGTCTCTSNY
jgi:hypothetical protein